MLTYDGEKNVHIHRYLTLNGNKMKHSIPSTIKNIGEINTFSNTGSHKVSYVLRSHCGHR